MRKKMSDPVESVWQDVGEALIEPPEFVVDNLIPVGVTFVAGPPKSYKSAVELAAVLTACGVINSVLPPDLSSCPEPGRVLMLSSEATAGVLRHTAKHGFGVDIPNDMRLLAMSDPWRWRLDQLPDVRELLDWAEELDAAMICIDPLRNFHSLDENDSGGMIQMLQPLQQWAMKNKRAVLIVHHSKKLGEDKDGGKKTARADDMRGTSALFGLADAVLTVTPKNSKGLINVDAILKRGEAWERTIQLGIWGATTTESVDAEAKMVFGLLKTGLPQTGIMSAMKLSKTQLAEAMNRLKRLGAITPDGSPTEKGAELVQNAVRKYASKM